MEISILFQENLTLHESGFAFSIDYFVFFILLKIFSLFFYVGKRIILILSLGGVVSYLLLRFTRCLLCWVCWGFETSVFGSESDALFQGNGKLGTFYFISMLCNCLKNGKFCWLHKEFTVNHF